MSATNVAGTGEISLLNTVGPKVETSLLTAPTPIVQGGSPSQKLAVIAWTQLTAEQGGGINVQVSYFLEYASWPYSSYTSHEVTG